MRQNNSTGQRNNAAGNSQQQQQAMMHHHQNTPLAQPGSTALTMNLSQSMYQDIMIQVMHINQRIKIRLSDNENLAQFFHKLLVHFEVTEKNSPSYLGLIERRGKNDYHFVRERKELQNDRLYYLYFRDKPDKYIVEQEQILQEEQKKPKNSGSAANWGTGSGSHAYKAGIMQQNNRSGSTRITSHNMTFQGGVMNMAQAYIEKVKRPKEEKKILICPFEKCLKEFSETGNLKTHMRTHTGERPFVCSQCDQQFITKGHLQAHELTHTGEKPFKCPHPGCTKRYSRAGRLKIHQRLHTGERPFICQMEGCEKAFREKGNLLTHMRIHNGQKPFRCDFADCEMSFTTQGHLTDHKRRHSGERPYICEVCGDKFMRSSTLKIHMRRHTGEKPYQCLKCDRAFSESGNLRTHQRVHEDGHSSLGKRSRQKSNSRYTTPAVSPMSLQRRIQKVNRKQMGGLKTLNPSGVRYQMRTPRTNMMSSHPRDAEGEDENPKIIFDSDVRHNEEDEDVSPCSPLRLKLKKVPQIQLDYIQQRGTANTTKVGSSITADHPFEDVVVNRNRRANDNQELQQNIQASMKIMNNNAYAKQIRYKGQEQEDIKLPMMKIDQTNHQQLLADIFNNGNSITNRIEQFNNLPSLTPIYQQLGSQFITLNNGNQIFDSTPLSFLNQQQTSNQQLQQQMQQLITQHQNVQHQQQHQQQQQHAQQLALSLGNQVLNNQSNQQHQGNTNNNNHLYYPFSPTGMLSAMHNNNNNHNNQQSIVRATEGNGNGAANQNGGIPVYSPKGPLNFLAAVQQVQNNNPGTGQGVTVQQASYVLNTPTNGADDSSRNRRARQQHMNNQIMAQQLLNASASGVAGSAGVPANLLMEDSASNKVRKSIGQNNMMSQGGAAGTTSSFNQQHQHQQQVGSFQAPQNLDKYSPKPTNSGNLASFSQAVEQNHISSSNVEGVHRNQVGVVDVSPRTYAITKQKIFNSGQTPQNNNTAFISSSNNQQQQQIKPVNQLPMTFTNLSSLSLTKPKFNQSGGSQQSSAQTTREGGIMQLFPEDDPHSFSRLSAKMWDKKQGNQQSNSRGNSPFNKNQFITQGSLQALGTPHGHNNNMHEINMGFNGNLNQAQKHQAQQMTVGSTHQSQLTPLAFMSENSAFKKSSPKNGLHLGALQSTTNTSLVFQNQSMKNSMPFSGNNTPRIFHPSCKSSTTDQLPPMTTSGNYLQSNQKGAFSFSSLQNHNQFIINNNGMQNSNHIQKNGPSGPSPRQMQGLPGQSSTSLVFSKGISFGQVGGVVSPSPRAVARQNSNLFDDYAHQSPSNINQQVNNSNNVGGSGAAVGNTATFTQKVSLAQIQQQQQQHQINNRLQ